MLAQLERTRKRDIFCRLFEPHSKEDKKLNHRRKGTASEVREFLALSGRDHRKYFQYTDLNALCGMLKSGQLWLTRADKLNDLKEFGAKEERQFCYIASFGTSALENVAMWWMYGLNGIEKDPKRIPVRLEFDGKAILSSWKAVLPGRPDCIAPVPVGGGHSLPQVTEVLLHDMLYQRNHSHRKKPDGKRWHGAVSWNGHVADEVRCKKAFENAVESLPGFVKDVGWAYENETRITIRLAEAGPDKIAIPFVDALKSVRVLVGPGGDRNSNAAKRRMDSATQRILEMPKHPDLSPMSDWSKRIEASHYLVQFAKDSNKH